MAQDALEAARRNYAQELRYKAHVAAASVVAAFASVRREDFVGPGPWRILNPVRVADYELTPDADPRRLYQDVLVALDPVRRVNNGQPSLWARLFDALSLAPGSHVVHVGAGTGYYSAILAEIVGPTGRLVAVEIDPGLAAKARRNLLPWPQAELVIADGFTYRPGRPVDAVVINAGVSHLSLAWLDALAPEKGRLLVPLTQAGGVGGFLLISRRGRDTIRYPARLLCYTGIIPCVGGRDAAAEARLGAALARSDFAAIRSLRRPPEPPDDSAWLEGEGWWLSTAPVANP